MRRIIVACLLGWLLAACGGSGSHKPVDPTPMTPMPMGARQAMPANAPPSTGQFLRDRNQFASFEDHGVRRVAEWPVSTFAADVDTASYSFSRRQLSAGRLPHPHAVRVEEWLNYFDYAYPLPADTQAPFATQVTVTDSPWKAGNKLLHIGIQGYEPQAQQNPRANLVFLLDVSGSMVWSENKLPLVKRSLSMMLNEMSPDATVAIVVYAGSSGVVLPPTAVREKARILLALEQLEGGGSTAGGEGIELAYRLAEANFDPEAVNRIFLATDGDFNVGVTGHEALMALVARKRQQGIYLSVLGFGDGDYNDQLMQALAQNGNGVAAYIDTLNEARKVLVTEADALFFPIADDLKIQVDFNPATVLEYRLLGYETRALRREDFNNDAVDAGDIGAGHSVTALYEITPVGATPLMTPSRYEKPPAVPVDADGADEYAFVKLSYKLPGEPVSKLMQTPVPVGNTDTADALRQQEVAFATAVAGAAQLLRVSRYTGEWTLDDAIQLGDANRGEDRYGYRAEFVQLLRLAEAVLRGGKPQQQD